MELLSLKVQITEGAQLLRESGADQNPGCPAQHPLTWGQVWEVQMEAGYLSKRRTIEKPGGKAERGMAVGKAVRRLIPISLPRSSDPVDSRGGATISHLGLPGWFPCRRAVNQALMNPCLRTLLQFCSSRCSKKCFIMWTALSVRHTFNPFCVFLSPFVGLVFFFHLMIFMLKYVSFVRC